MPCERILKVGIVGLGHLHPRLYMPIFGAVPSIKVIAVSEADKALRDAFCADFGVKAFDSVAGMLSAEKLDIAAVFLPHADCPAAAEACARAGVHLMVEKPMAASAQGAARIVKAAVEHGVKLTTGYCWRMHPAARELKRLVRSGVVGRVIGAEGRCAAGRLQRYIDGKASWMLQRARSGGGPMYNLGVHWIDLYRWLLADEVFEVIGKNVHINTQYDIEDNSFALLTFTRGTVLALDISYTVPESYPFGRDLYLALRGATGVLSWSPSFEGAKERLFVCSDSGEFSQASRQHLDFDLPPQTGYAGAMGHNFITGLMESIRSRKPPAITGQDGLKALEVVEAIYQSAESGRSVRL